MTCRIPPANLALSQNEFGQSRYVEEATTSYSESPPWLRKSKTLPHAGVRPRQHYQRDTIKLDEVQQVLGSLPARVGNDIARTALPIITHARKEELASQLVENLPDTHKRMKQ